MIQILAYTEQKYVYGEILDPGKPKPGIMQVFYENEVPKMVDFLCPCGCESTCPIHVITMEEKNNPPPEKANIWKNHCWGFDQKSLTLQPSIRYIGGCKAHFSIENSKVIFHEDSGR